ncbi:hypothetical protein PAPYR_2451 [Paratrimastix pyriformis]|uniref:RING-type domain-containing protein n=1 Tax=Paratrimastix pyriformis TaxID=342808 RepID=A0ABQ8UTY5_9EUKA|nr:hypothetical protein PAPYR_2451 [Paratrimastix pyriformis]
MSGGVPCCHICEEAFDLAEHDPVVLFCGHTFCRNCMCQLALKNPDHPVLDCPECRTPTPVPRPFDPACFRRNFGLADMLPGAHGKKHPRDPADTLHDLTARVQEKIEKLQRAKDEAAALTLDAVVHQVGVLGIAMHGLVDDYCRELNEAARAKAPEVEQSIRAAGAHIQELREALAPPPAKMPRPDEAIGKLQALLDAPVEVKGFDVDLKPPTADLLDDLNRVDVKRLLPREEEKKEEEEPPLVFANPEVAVALRVLSAIPPGLCSLSSTAHANCLPLFLPPAQANSRPCKFFPSSRPCKIPPMQILVSPCFCLPPMQIPDANSCLPVSSSRPCKMSPFPPPAHAARPLTRTRILAWCRRLIDGGAPADGSCPAAMLADLLEHPAFAGDHLAMRVILEAIAASTAPVRSRRKNVAARPLLILLNHCPPDLLDALVRAIFIVSPTWEPGMLPNWLELRRLIESPASRENPILLGDLLGLLCAQLAKQQWDLPEYRECAQLLAHLILSPDFLTNYYVQVSFVLALPLLAEAWKKKLFSRPFYPEISAAFRVFAFLIVQLLRDDEAMSIPQLSEALLGTALNLGRRDPVFKGTLIDAGLTGMYDRLLNHPTITANAAQGKTLAQLIGLFAPEP